MDNPFLIFAVAALLSVAGGGLGLSSAWLRRVFADIPNARSAHQTPVPRFGGLVVWIAAIASLAWLEISPPDAIWVLLAPALISAADDVKPVPAQYRLAVHLAAATAAAWLLSAPGGTLPLTVLVLVWLANLFNFMDGSDGLVGSGAIIHLSALAMALPAGPWSSLVWVVAAALAGVLVFNLPPARLFLGDGGSVPLGMLIGIVGLFGVFNRHWDWWFPLLVVFPFFLDATWTMLRRLFAGQKIWLAHREHLYQRLADRGVSTRRIMFIGILTTLFSATMAHAALRLGGAAGAWFAILVIALMTAAYSLTRARLAHPIDSDDN